MIQDSDDIAVQRLLLGADRNFYVRIRLMKLKQPRHHVVVVDRRVIEINQASLGHSDRDVILLGSDRLVRLFGLGRLTRMPFMWVWLKLTIMKLARRKNMMSINGMISMRACFFGMGERILMVDS